MSGTIGRRNICPKKGRIMRGIEFLSEELLGVIFILSGIALLRARREDIPAIVKALRGWFWG